MKKNTENALWDLASFKLHTLYTGDLWNDCTLWTVPRAPTLLVSLLKEKLEGDGKQVEFLKEWGAKSQNKLFTLAHIPHIGLDGILHGLQTPNEAFFSLKSQTFGLGQTNWADKFLGLWGIFGWFKAFISTSQIYIWDWDLNLNLNLGCK